MILPDPSLLWGISLFVLVCGAFGSTTLCLIAVVGTARLRRAGNAAESGPAISTRASI